MLQSSLIFAGVEAWIKALSKYQLFCFWTTLASFRPVFPILLQLLLLRTYMSASVNKLFFWLLVNLACCCWSLYLFCKDFSLLFLCFDIKLANCNNPSDKGFPSVQSLLNMLSIALDWKVAIHIRMQQDKKMSLLSSFQFHLMPNDFPWFLEAPFWCSFAN